MNGQKLFEEIYETIRRGGMIRIDGNLVTTFNFDEWKDEPENEVIYFGWEEEGEEYSDKITEEDLNNANIRSGDIVILEIPTEGNRVCYSSDTRISLYRKYEVEKGKNL